MIVEYPLYNLDSYQMMVCQKFWNILVSASLQHIYHVFEQAQAVKGRRCSW